MWKIITMLCLFLALSLSATAKEIGGWYLLETNSPTGAWSHPTYSNDVEITGTANVAEIGWVFDSGFTLAGKYQSVELEGKVNQTASLGSATQTQEYNHKFSYSGPMLSLGYLMEAGGFYFVPSYILYSKTTGTLNYTLALNGTEYVNTDYDMDVTVTGFELPVFILFGQNTFVGIRLANYTVTQAYQSSGFETTMTLSQTGFSIGQTF